MFKLRVFLKERFLELVLDFFGGGFGGVSSFFIFSSLFLLELVWLGFRLVFWIIKYLFSFEFDLILEFDFEFGCIMFSIIFLYVSVFECEFVFESFLLIIFDIFLGVIFVIFFIDLFRFWLFVFFIFFCGFIFSIVVLLVLVVFWVVLFEVLRDW